MNQKLEDLLQLALQTSEETRERTEDLNVGFNGNNRTWEVIVKYHGSLDRLRTLNVKVEYLIAGYAILTVPEQLVEAVAELEEIEYVEKPKRYFYQVTDPVQDSCIAQVSGRDFSLTGTGVVTRNEALSGTGTLEGTGTLTGVGVLIAVLDSGIDYRLPEFRRADGSTRIRYLWDQTLRADEENTALEAEQGIWSGEGQRRPPEEQGISPGERQRRPPEGFEQGVEFDAGQINAALQAPSVQQFRLLPSMDTGGHGTAVAGIAAGYSAGSYCGVAPGAELLIVKLGTPDASAFPRTTEIMRGVTWALGKAQELQMPLAINLSFGNNYGAHDGSSLIERFLDNAAEIGRTVICVGSGNEGANGGHLAGSLERTGSMAGLPSGRQPAFFYRSAQVELAVAEYEQSLNVQLWQNYSDSYRIYLRSPGGQETQLPESVEGGKYTLQLEQTEILVYMGEPTPYAAPREIYLDMLPVGRPYINSGVWIFRLEPLEVVTGNYYFYLPSSAARNERTEFYRSTPDVTLTIPSTAAKVITVGAYDSVYDAYADFSGRGYADLTRTIGVVTAGVAKPDLVAPGVGVLAPDIYGGNVPVTGTSFATPIVSGSAALLMEWGIVRGNDPFLYGEKVKAYLRKGARPLRGETTYPNERVGWGKLCVSESLPE